MVLLAMFNCRCLFAMAVMKAVGSKKMCTNVHFPEDLSFEFLVPATTEAILPAVDSNDLGHRHCRSVRFYRKLRHLYLQIRDAWFKKMH